MMFLRLKMRFVRYKWRFYGMQNVILYRKNVIYPVDVLFLYRKRHLYRKNIILYCKKSFYTIKNVILYRKTSFYIGRREGKVLSEHGSN